MQIFNNKKVDFVCINVASNEQRKKHIEKIAVDNDIPMRFFSAITPKRLDEVYSDYKPLRTKLWWGRPLIPTEQACGLSHIQIWRDFIKSENDYILIFEDDIAVKKDFMKVVKNIFNLNKTYDFIKLSGQHNRPKILKQDLNYNNYMIYQYAYGPVDAACYILSKKGAVLLEKYCSKMHMAVDIMMDRSFEHGVDCHCVLPYPADPIVDHSGPLISQIGHEDRKNKYDHNNFFIKIVTRLLRLYSSFQKRYAAFKLYF